jgi:hypothetical protein
MWLVVVQHRSDEPVPSTVADAVSGMDRTNANCVRPRLAISRCYLRSACARSDSVNAFECIAAETPLRSLFDLMIRKQPPHLPLLCRTGSCPFRLYRIITFSTSETSLVITISSSSDRTRIAAASSAGSSSCSWWWSLFVFGRVPPSRGLQRYGAFEKEH